MGASDTVPSIVTKGFVCELQHTSGRVSGTGQGLPRVVDQQIERFVSPFIELGKEVCGCRGELATIIG
jgi:hypothetical protein